MIPIQLLMPPHVSTWDALSSVSVDKQKHEITGVRVKVTKPVAESLTIYKLNVAAEICRVPNVSRHGE